MKIKIRSSRGDSLTIPFPNAMLFSPTIIRLILRVTKSKADPSVPDVPAETVEALCRAIKDAKRKHGEWVFLHAESSSGDLVDITV